MAHPNIPAGRQNPYTVFKEPIQPFGDQGEGEGWSTSDQELSMGIDNEIGVAFLRIGSIPLHFLPPDDDSPEGSPGYIVSVKEHPNVDLADTAPGAVALWWYDDNTNTAWYPSSTIGQFYGSGELDVSRDGLHVRAGWGASFGHGPSGDLLQAAQGAYALLAGLAGGAHPRPSQDVVGETYRLLTALAGPLWEVANIAGALTAADEALGGQGSHFEGEASEWGSEQMQWVEAFARHLSRIEVLATRSSAAYTAYTAEGEVKRSIDENVGDVLDASRRII